MRLSVGLDFVLVFYTTAILNMCVVTWPKGS